MTTRRRQSGFTLAEVMTVVVIIGVMAALATVSLTKGRAEIQIDTLANQVRNMMVSARRRAIANNSTYLVDVTTNTVQFCQIDPTINPPQGTCPTVNTTAHCNGVTQAGAIGLVNCENSAPYTAGKEAQVVGSQQVADVVSGGLQPNALPNGGHQPVYFFRDGTADYRTGVTPYVHQPASVQIAGGATLYLSGVSTSLKSKHRKVVVYPGQGRPRVIDSW
jgi:prepilin-type N-terminal cleavage/methylation domain-containing protein